MLARLVIVSLVAGCGAAASTPAAPTLPAATTRCFEGTSTIGGQATPALLRRTVDPAQARVTEDITGMGRDAVVDFHVEMQVATDGNFTMRETGGAFTGSGHFTAGEPWAWTGWQSSSKGPPEQGGWLATSTDTLAGASLTAHKRVTFGEQVMELEEQFAEVTCDVYASRRAALHGQ